LPSHACASTAATYTATNACSTPNACTTSDACTASNACATCAYTSAHANTSPTS